MYGVVLMMAMAGGAETPALFNRGCKGCSGCSGTASYSCTGYSCSGYSCSGCSGHRTHKMKRSKGCCGYATCCGTPVVSCCGAPAVSCYGSPAVGCQGAPMSYGAPMTHGAPMTYGAPDMAHPGVMEPGMKLMPDTKVADPKTDGKKIEKLKKPPVDNETVEAAPARITITVPSDARVSIDGSMTVSTDTTRIFESPTLQVGKSYSYTFQAEFVRDGKEVVVTREVKVQAGTDVTVSLENSSVVASR